jgi:hypothetical protein
LPSLDYFLLTATLTAIVTDYTDQDDTPDQQPISCTVEFRPRIPSGKLVWVPGLTPPQGLALPGIKARCDSDGVLRTIQDAAVDEQQTITVTGNPFTVSFKSVATGNLSSTATAAQVQTAIEALSTVGVSNAAVSGPNGGPFAVVFNDALGDQDVPQMTATNATITTTRAGTLAAGVKLTAGTSVLGLGTYNPQSATGGLVYDVVWSNVVFNKKLQTIDPFGFVAQPEWAGTTVDLATITKIPPLAGI